jgi:hypothetical protein
MPEEIRNAIQPNRAMRPASTMPPASIDQSPMSNARSRPSAISRGNTLTSGAVSAHFLCSLYQGNVALAVAAAQQSWQMSVDGSREQKFPKPRGRLGQWRRRAPINIFLSVAILYQRGGRCGSPSPSARAYVSLGIQSPPRRQGYTEPADFKQNESRQWLKCALWY